MCPFFLKYSKKVSRTRWAVHSVVMTETVGSEESRGLRVLEFETVEEARCVVFVSAKVFDRRTRGMLLLVGRAAGCDVKRRRRLTREAGGERSLRLLEKDEKFRETAAVDWGSL